MKRILLITALFVAVSVAAQNGTPNHNAIQNEGRAPYRTRFISYDIRGEVDADKPVGSKYYRPLSFKPKAGGDFPLFEATVEIPSLWLERDIYIRDEGHTGRYLLRVNEYTVGVNSDTWGGGDYYLTPYLREGDNNLELEFATDYIPGGDMEYSISGETLSRIGNLYLWSQPKIHVFDYTIKGYPHPEGLDGVVELNVVMTNGYNFPETVTVGYDIYDPAGNLKSYNFVDAVIRGAGSDTVRFRDKLIGYQNHLYSAEKPGLYRIVLSVKYDNRPIEYIPVRLGFGTTRFDGTQLLRNDKPIKISAAEFEATDRKTTLTQLRALKKRGINTLYLARPEQKWFYDLCEAEGLYLIDCAAVECDPRDDDRGIGGTIANSPDHLPRFIDRQQELYYRGRNRANIIGWNIGSPSGNGYNMYKSYQWLKSADSTRMVVYRGANGEWNTDIELPTPQK
jgi:beta-galactosidase